MRTVETAQTFLAASEVDALDGDYLTGMVWSCCYGEVLSGSRAVRMRLSPKRNSSDGS